MAPRDLHRYQNIAGRAPYRALAPLYDRIMAYVDYDAWVRLIRAICATHLPGIKPKIFEIGAGTGVLGRKLLDRGYSYLGSDLCDAMCNQAHGKGLPFLCADGRCLPLKCAFDMILFLYDGINYLQANADYTRLFEEVHGRLVPGGLFLFDITTETNSLAHFRDFLDFEDFGDVAYVRHSYYESHERNQHNNFTIFIRNECGSVRELYEKVLEHHVQRVRPVGEIRQCIPAGRFTVEGIWDGYSFKKYSARSDRIHFLLRKTVT